MPLLKGPPWIWKVTYEDDRFSVKYNVLGPRTGVYWAQDKEIPQFSFRASALHAALLGIWLKSKFVDVKEYNETPRRK